mmetsp:Transcript_53713/g.100655  ORF Transcript_53713/g.100655 Transcript_53713/m.100655 type:complete len:652 (+) Transcript_53713:67-2022(+)
MKYRFAAAWWALALLQAVQAVQAPVDKVLTLLADMKTKGIAEMDEEKTQHAEFTAFCDKTLAEKKGAITEGKESVDQLKADIEKFQASIAKLGEEIDTHSQEIVTTAKDTADAKALRAQEATDFAASLKEYEESIDAIGRATQTLKDQDFSRPQAEKKALLQASQDVERGLLGHVSATSKPQEVKSALMTFLQDPNGYDFQSGSIIDMLKKLKAKFEEEKESLEKTEADKKSSHGLLLTSLANQLAASEEAKADKTGFRSKAEQDLTTAKSDLEETEKTLAADTKYREDLQLECKEKTEQFEASQKLRTEELEAIGMATEIISGKSVAGAAEKHMSGLLQSSTSLALLRAQIKKPAQFKTALKILQDGARDLDSHDLGLLVQKINGLSDGPNSDLSSIKTLLEKLLANLEATADSEVEHQAFCKKELAGNNRTRTKTTEGLESVSAELDQLQASLAKITEEIAETSSQITELSSAMSEATALRQKEKGKNQATIKDSQVAQDAVAQAMGLLQDFYEKAGASFLQGATSQKKILVLLESLLGDFSRLEAETSAAEQASEGEYRKFMEDSRTDQAEKKIDSQHLEEKKQQQTALLAQGESDKASLQTQLESANKYYEELQKQCISDESDANKKEALRQREIENLKTALKELSD